MLLKKVYQVSRKGTEETPRLFLQHLVCEAAQFETGEKLYISVKNREIIIEEKNDNDSYEISVSSRLNQSTGKRRPLIDTARNSYKDIISVDDKIEICVYHKKIIIRPLKFNLMDIMQLPEKDDQRIKLLSLCAGGGIGTACFKNTGYFSPEMEIELEEDCCETLRYNFPSSFIFNGDMRDVNEVAKVEAALVSMPCNEHSNLGTLEEGLQTNLAIAATRILKAAQPEMIFFENVPLFFSSKLFQDIKGMMIDAFPYWSEKNIESYEFGSIARRNRTYAMAFRSEESFLNFEFPQKPRTTKRSKIKKFLDGNQIKHEWKSLDKWMKSFNSRAAFKDRKLDKTFVTEEAKEVQCILKRYRSHCPSNTYLLNEDRTKWRFFSENELLRMLSVPKSFQIPETVPMSRRYEIIGQSMDCRVVTAFANEIAKTFMKIKSQTKKFIEKTKQTASSILPISVKEDGQLTLTF